MKASLDKGISGNQVLKKPLIAVVVLIGILYLFVYPKVYVLRGSGGGVGLYWTGNEALLFACGGMDGARMSLFRYAAEPFLVSMGDVRQPDDERRSNISVIRVTDEDVQRYDTDIGCDVAFDLFEGNIYAIRWPNLWRWTRNDFDPATTDYATFQAGRATLNKPNSAHPWMFDNVDGWSMRQLGSTGSKYEIGGRPVTITQVTLNSQSVSFVYSGPTFPVMPISVDLVRSGQSPQTIWSFDERPHRVSKAEYERAFSSR